MTELEKIATEIDTFLRGNGYKIRLGKRRGGLAEIPDWAAEAFIREGLRVDQESWHIGLELKPNYVPEDAPPGHKWGDLSIAVVRDDREPSFGQVEIWLTDLTEQACQVDTLDYSLDTFWYDFQSIVDSMAVKD